MAHLTQQPLIGLLAFITWPPVARSLALLPYRSPLNPPSLAPAPLLHAHPGPSTEGLVPPSGNRPGLVTHRGDDGLTAHLRESPGPSGKQAQSYIKYGGEKENMFYLLARTEGKGDRNVFCTICIKTWSWHAAFKKYMSSGVSLRPALISK